MTFLINPREPSPLVSTSIAAVIAVGVLLLSGCSHSSSPPAAASTSSAAPSAPTAAPHPVEAAKVIFESADYDRQAQVIAGRNRMDLAGALDTLIKVRDLMANRPKTPSAAMGNGGPPKAIMDKMRRLLNPTKLKAMGELRNIMTQREMDVIVKHPKDRAIWLQGAQLDLAADHPRVTVRTDRGDFVLEIRPQGAEITAASFIALASAHFYDHHKFDRFVPGLLIQGGSLNGDGTGGPGYTIPDEDGTMLHDVGTLAMAKTAPNKAGSEFYIALGPAPQLDHHYTVFGLVIQGMDVVRKLTKGDTIISMTVTNLPDGYNTSEGVKIRRA
ncbi:MAG TPA: peptidylprolyl isomerase [Armatimonadota bacterium]|nr:peptidylprolyl isomerase [Armatimonadota bacterium]